MGVFSIECFDFCCMPYIYGKSWREGYALGWYFLCIMRVLEVQKLLPKVLYTACLCKIED